MNKWNKKKYVIVQVYCLKINGAVYYDHQKSYIYIFVNSDWKGFEVMAQLACHANTNFP